MSPSQWYRGRTVGAIIILVLGMVVTAPVPTTVARNGTLTRPTLADPGPANVCGIDSPLSIKATADELLLDRYHLGGHPVVTLPHELTWTEDPLSDRNWSEKLHMLRFVMALMYQWKASDAPKYLDRALELVHSWIDLNPRDAPPARYSWGDHSTAWRAMIMVCMAQLMPAVDWLDASIALHGETLADPAFYKVTGNHALNQDIGLLDVGCYLGRTDWQQLAAQRINQYIVSSIDDAGVSGEQAVRYDRYTYYRFMAAREHLAWCGYPEPAAFRRVDRVPGFLAQATRPDGDYETIGDSPTTPASVIRGTDAEFAATLGRQGSKPADTATVFAAGYAFGRTGWGEARRFTDEAFFSLRFGPGTSSSGHAHDDGGSVTLYGWGSPLIVDPGFGDYNQTPWRTFFKSRAAHSAVVVSGLSPHPERPSVLERQSLSSRAVDLIVRVNVYPGLTMRRRIIFSRQLGYLVVEDTMSSSTARTYRQLWHLPEDALPLTTGAMTWSGRSRGNVLIRQLLGGGTTRTITGATNPIQGWISHVYGQHLPAPVIEYRRTGTQVRFLTLLMPYRRGTPSGSIQGLRITGDGFSFTIGTQDRHEHVQVTGARATIADAP